MDRRFGIVILSIMSLLLLSGCYCTFDGDEQSEGTLDYFEGCFHKAKHG